MPAGRPTDYSDELAAKICHRLVEGESLRSICRSDGMPHISTVYRWLFAHKTFSEHYATAREDQADTLADEILDIADDSRNDWMEREKNGKTETVVDLEHINRSRLRIDTRKWIASKLKPKRYGERIENIHKGDAAHPIVVAQSDAAL